MGDGPRGCTHVPTRFRDAWLNGWVDELRPQAIAREAAARFIAGEAENLMLIGRYGVGKSMLAAIIVNETRQGMLAEARALWRGGEAFAREGHNYLEMEAYLARIHALEGRDRCPRWVNVGRAVVDLKADMNGHRSDTADELAAIRSKKAVLVLDDVGVGVASDWSAEVLYGLISARYDEGRKTIVTTNLRPSELERAGYGAIVSRMVEGGLLVDLGSVDYRHRLRANRVELPAKGRASESLESEAAG
jgi:DNA replication protein DnaC